MQYMKKYFTEGLIQFTILLSLIGVRVDIDSYFSGYISPLIETDGGPSSAFIQTPFHHLRDNAAGLYVHPKCPELDFTSQRLLSEIRALGSPTRFHTRLDAWLVHLVHDGSELSEPQQDGAGSNSQDGSNESPEDGADSNRETYPSVLPETVQHTATRPRSTPREQQQQSAALNHGVEENGSALKEEEEEEEICPAPLVQLAHSSALEQEGLLSNSVPSPPSLPGLDLHQRWQEFLSLPEFDDLDSLAPQSVSDLGASLSSPISHNVSLQDAMATSGGDYRPYPLRRGAQTSSYRHNSILRSESTNSSHSDASPGATSALTPPLFSLMGNGSRNGTGHTGVGGYLDEAVFEQINLLGLEGLTTIDTQLLEAIDSTRSTAQLSEDFDSDSGLSLESCSRSPASSTSSDSLCEYEGGATGYSSEVESCPSKAEAYASARCSGSPMDMSENIWHDHTYSVPLLSNHSSYSSSSPRAIKQELKSEDEEDDLIEELTRDERRVQALGLPYSAPQIVNMPVEDFLELLDGRGLSGSEITLLRDVRRRGKNKLAAQNCRKRKLDAILGLQGEVESLTAQRDALLRQRDHTAKALSAASLHLETLSQDMLGRLRDEHGRPLTPAHYTLHCSTSGRVVVRPRTHTNTVTRTSSTGGKTDKRKKNKKP